MFYMRAFMSDKVESSIIEVLLAINARVVDPVDGGARGEVHLCWNLYHLLAFL